MKDSHQDQLTAQQHRAIEALLVEPSVGKAAQRSEVAERTMYRWLRQKEFARLLRERRRQAFGQSIAMAQRYAALAVQTLGQLMLDQSTPAMARVKAAAEILSFARDGIEIDDLVHRVEDVETMAHELRIAAA